MESVIAVEVTPLSLAIYLAALLLTYLNTLSIGFWASGGKLHERAKLFLLGGLSLMGILFSILVMHSTSIQEAGGEPSSPVLVLAILIAMILPFIVAYIGFIVGWRKKR